MKIQSILLGLILFFSSYLPLVCIAQENVPTAPLTSLPKAAVLNVDASGLVEDPGMLGNLLRLELQKLKRYQVMDKYDMKDLLASTEIDMMNCYSTRCLLEAGQVLEVDKMITGNAESFMDKIIITIKIVDVKTGLIEAAEVGEYLNMEDELQNMLMLSLNDLLEIENDPMIVNNLAFYDILQTPRSSRIINNGPRIGFAYIGGGTAERLQAPLDQGGYDALPMVSQLGFQYEVQYMSSGNFQALIETIGLIGGLEQSMFIPSLVILNGFRENKYGFEIGFGPSISVRNVAQGYYDETGAWRLASEHDFSQGPNPFPLIEQLDSRGNPELYTRWIWAVGKTFRSGHLNIPVNIFASSLRRDWQVGVSVGFNLQKNRRTN
ncbi:MAG: hypothetical protein AAF927_34535 [Bacteroidota bacterium]